MLLRGHKSAWKVWLVSYAVWIFLAFMAGFSMYRFNVLFWKPSGSLWDEVRLPLINYLIFATFTPSTAANQLALPHRAFELALAQPFVLRWCACLR